MVRAIQYAMGANPMNLNYISGLGERAFLPYQLDWFVSNSHILSGIPNFGHMTYTETRWAGQANGPSMGTGGRIVSLRVKAMAIHLNLL